MATKRAISEFRDIDLTFTGGVDAGIDAYKAAIGKIEEIESLHFNGTFVDLAAVSTLCYGTIPFQVHVFEFTTTIATGVYVCEYIETVPTAADVS